MDSLLADDLEQIFFVLTQDDIDSSLLDLEQESFKYFVANR